MPTTIIATGGTIASRTGLDGLPVAALDAHALIASVPALRDDPTISGHDLRTVNSWAFTTRDMLGIVAAIDDVRAADPHRGIVVTHGTDTLEETAFLIDLLVARDGRPPVVVTGAMRTADHPEPDGPANLRDAVAVAQAPQVRGCGALVVIDGCFHAAVETTKVASDGLAALRSPGPEGPLGRVEHGCARLDRSPPPRPEPSSGFLGPVELVVVHPDLGGDAIDRLVERDVRGLVVQGTGLGNVPPVVATAIERAIAAGVVVVVARRPLTGRTDLRYGGEGGGGRLAAAGAIGAGRLSAHQARLALGVALARDPAPDAVRAWFAPW